MLELKLPLLYNCWLLSKYDSSDQISFSSSYDDFNSFIKLTGVTTEKKDDDQLF